MGRLTLVDGKLQPTHGTIAHDLIFPRAVVLGKLVFKHLLTGSAVNTDTDGIALANIQRPKGNRVDLHGDGVAIDTWQTVDGCGLRSSGTGSDSNKQFVSRTTYLFIVCSCMVSSCALPTKQPYSLLSAFRRPTDGLFLFAASC